MTERPASHIRLTLRPPRPDDAPAIAELETAGLPEALRVDPALAPLLAIQARARAASLTSAFPEALNRVAELEGQTVARLITAREADRLHIVDVAVTPSARRRGIGAALLDALKAEAGPAPLTANIFPENHASLALFAAAGFELRHEDGSAQVQAHWENDVIDS
ncbi:GNAT family N-acetyltransferase [Brevundimonas lenta]|uniref:Ribosomal protein S18 acetylase RimI-like enzyme n=1 Tax=Brevundimonas lenta TaxID=424796 RepID=A0A7W6NNR8_9CAUL|nr:GNAT family N-acetyltransferase [Brevundimonas lenta]MBB4081739.1 ribosomal protein S18 acetylase RimI-like enzyme [Brevundimonas lenta]